MLILLLQIAVIVAMAHLARRVFIACNQPAVIGEMAAGLLLGRSFFGWAMPQMFQALFNPATLAPLNVLSQVGLVLFMFIVGFRLRTHSLRTKRRTAIVVSGASIIVPFVCGAVLASMVHQRLAPRDVGALPFALFIGAAMSITAFPVLARILIAHGLLTTELGILAITCAAFDDVTGWLVLAGILTLVQAGDPYAFATRLLVLLVYVAVMVLIVRRGLRWAAHRFAASTRSAPALLICLVVVFASAAVTDTLGVHALFGAFFAGVMMPDVAELERAVTARVEPITMTILVPVFFAFTGLHTNLHLIDSAALWRDSLLVLVVAIAAKGGASAIAGRAMGLRWREATALGVLVNTRGLVELVILNIGLELRILSPVIYAMLVLMALITTAMTSPLITALRLSGEHRRS